MRRKTCNMLYYTDLSIKRWSVKCADKWCASNQSTDPEGSCSQSSRNHDKVQFVFMIVSAKKAD